MEATQIKKMLSVLKMLYIILLLNIISHSPIVISLQNFDSWLSIVVS